MDIHCFKDSKEYTFTSYLNKEDASIDGGVAFSFFDEEVKFLATIKANLVNHKSVLFHFIDDNGEERAVLEDSTPYGYELYASFSNISSKSVIIPGDFLGGKIVIEGGHGNNGQKGAYAKSNTFGSGYGKGGSGGSGGQGLIVTYPNGTLITYGGGGGGGGAGGTEDPYGRVIRSAGTGGTGGLGSSNELLFKNTWKGITLTLSRNYSGNSGGSGTSNGKYRGGNGGNAGNGNAGGSRSGQNGGKGGNAGTSTRTENTNAFYLYKAVY